MAQKDVFSNLQAWVRNLSVESNKLKGGSNEFKQAFLDQLIDCRSAICQVGWGGGPNFGGPILDPQIGWTILIK